VKYFFSAWNHFLERVARSKRIFLFLDYDGTLTPIVKRPELARITPQQRKLLAALSQLKRYQLAIISGRALADVKKLARLKKIIFAGNHGMELSGPGIKFLHKKALSLNSIIKGIYRQLSKICKSFPGSIVENKGLTLSVHFRAVKGRRNIRNLSKDVRRLLNKKEYQGKLRLTQGKKVLELRPKVDWNKGKAVELIMKKMRLSTKSNLAVYIGDDTTDEDAFRNLQARGITIFVGKPKKDSCAKYYLRNTQQVYRFLNRLKEI